MVVGLEPDSRSEALWGEILSGVCEATAALGERKPILSLQRCVYPGEEKRNYRQCGETRRYILRRGDKSGRDDYMT